MSQFFNSVKFGWGSGSGYHLIIDYYKVRFYTLMMLMKFSFVPKNFFSFFFRIRIRISISKSLKIYPLCSKDIHQMWCRSAKFLSKSKSCLRSGSGSGSWFYFGFQCQTYIPYIEDTHQILFGSANSFESYCVHTKSSRTARQTGGRTDGRKFFLLVLSSKAYKTWTFIKRREFFFHSCDYWKD